jgi:hypothetical protein
MKKNRKSTISTSSNENSGNETDTLNISASSNEISQEDESNQNYTIKIYFKANEYYYGETNDELIPHGYGELHYANGDIYIGQFRNGNRIGKGLYKYNSGNVYKGTWENNIKSGEGIFVYVDNKFAFKGSFTNDNPDINSTYEFINENQYILFFTKNEYQYINANVYNNDNNKEETEINLSKVKLYDKSTYEEDISGNTNSNSSLDNKVNNIQHFSSKTISHKKDSSLQLNNIQSYECDISTNLYGKYFQHISI